MKYCGSCGSENAATAKFCRGCGVAVTVGTTTLSADLHTKEGLNWVNWIGIAALGGSLLACVYQFQQAKADWFVPVGLSNDAALIAVGQNHNCGYATFGGHTAPIARATKTGHFEYGDTAMIGNDQGSVMLQDRRGRVDNWHEPGASGYISLENVAYDQASSPGFIYNEWELSPFSTSAPPVFFTGDGLQASTFGTHYPNVKSDIDGDPKRFFSNGLFGYKKGDGTDAISVRYDRASHFSSDYAAQVSAVSQNGKWGFVGTTGLVIKPFEYDDIQIGRRYPRDNYWTVKKDGRWGLFQTTAKNRGFDAMTIEQLDKMTAERKAANVSFDTLISPRYEYALPYIENAQNGTLLAKTKLGWAFYDKKGMLKSERYYSDISLPVDIETPGVFQSLAGGFLWAKLNKYGEKMSIVAVEENGAWGFVDIDGKYLIEPNFGRPCGFVTINESIGR